MDAREALGVVVAGRTLTRREAESAMGSVMAGEATPAQLAALLAALAVRGETVDEIAGFAMGLRAAAVPVTVADGAIDTCGTGGDRSHTFNISTVAAIVAASAGARVAKHGNRAASSACGSADVLEALGVKIDLGPEAVATCVSEVGVGFMFAPRFHPAMRYAAPVRREIGIRTIFNVLGPLANPAGVKRQLLGVPSAVLGERMVNVLRELGAEHCLVVHSDDGLDEISPSGPTRTWELRGGTISEGELVPEHVGLECAPRGSVRGGDSATNARIARAVLNGEARDGALTAVLLNAGAACYVAGLAADVKGGVGLAANAIDTGAAIAMLERWAARSATLS
ncbi:MAG TPA: anthranilate phosphoribosyltransferase [Candidatus Limnocylindria bacterium]|nr:anthranilate phosphoribosyltransferase [Candidatus Limnocylindria bacterium]